MNRTLILAVLLFSASALSEPLLSYERALDSGPSFSAYLVSYQSAGLKVHAMVALPDAEVPESGFPVVVANHGYVPNPRKYGITAEGKDSRPGDYYRSVPELYTSRGFLVVLPDYRGHNSSEGYEQIKEQNRESVAYYADDVVALMAGLGEIEHVDLDNIFLWSHSMGGAVSIRVQLATDVIKAASYWATMPVSDLSDEFEDLNAPILIQHSSGDGSTSNSNSRDLANELQALQHPVVYFEYEGSDHYFEGETRVLAADRDAEFFRALIK